MEKVIKPLLNQIVWIITAVASCCVGLASLGISIVGNSFVGTLLALIVGVAGFVGIIMACVDVPDYCKIK